MSTELHGLIGMQPRGRPPGSQDSRRPRHPRGAQLQNLEEREKSPPHRHHHRHMQQLAASGTAVTVRTRLCCTTGMSSDSGDELNLRHLHCHREAPVEFVLVEMLQHVGHLLHLLHFLLQPLIFLLLVKLLEIGLITLRTFLLYCRLDFLPNRSLPSPSIPPRATRWRSR